jgi:cell shape-determining protein MreC
MRWLPPNTTATKGELVVTSGTVAPPDNSLYPPGLVIGQVTSVNEESAYTSVNVRPAANLHNLDVVDVLTSGAGGRASQLSTLISNLPAQNQGSSQSEQLASTGIGG